MQATEPLGHKWGKWETDKAATCEEAGVREHTCQRCKQVEYEEIPARGHSFGSWKTDAKTGEVYRICQTCRLREAKTEDVL